MGYNVTVANGIQAGLQSVCYAADVLHSGEESIMVASGTDENTDVTAELYGKLGLCAESKPYSLEKSGFRLGEGSVSLILETEESAAKRGVERYAELAGCAMTHKSVEFGKITGSESAMKQAVLQACEQAGITPDDISAVCAFADGHKTVDKLELSVYRELFGKEIPLICVKEEMGEARAAASTMQAAFAAKLLSGRVDSAKAYLLGKESLTEITVKSADMEYILAVGFGVGGSYSAAVLKKA